MEQSFDIRKRMRSIGDIRQMTRAMYLISAVKMKKARAQLAKTLPFFESCRLTMAQIHRLSPDVRNRYFTGHRPPKSEKRVLGYFLLTGDQGLAGAYNMNLLHAAEKRIRRDIVDQARKGFSAEARLFVAGTIGKDQLRLHGFEIDENFTYPIDSPTYFRAREISDIIHDKFERRELHEVYVVYTVIHSAIDMRPVVTRLVPIDADALLEGISPARVAEVQSRPSESIEYVPSPSDVMDYLVSTYLRGMVYGALTEAFASEQTARMTAMDNATENAEDILEKLRLQSNQLRQAAITAELSEIVGGAEVLSSADLIRRIARNE
jgi:F-type H+-transporting ATPase subunit gamma